MKQKIIMRLIGISLLAVFATTISITFVYYGLFQKQVRTDLRICADVLKDTHYFEDPSTSAEDVDLSNNLDDFRVTWISEDGTVLYDNDAAASSLENHKNRPEVKDAIFSGTGECVRTSDTMNMDTYYYAIMLNNGTILRVSTQARSMQSVFMTVMPMVLLLILLILIVCILLSQMLTKQLITPIEVIATNMMDNNINPPYKELVPFVNMIRTQHTDILSAAKARQDFTANVSHELKTPLTAISGYAELIENQMVTPENTVHFAGEIRKQSERLLFLINDTIRLSELDRTNRQFAQEDIELPKLLKDSIDALSFHSEKKHITVEAKLEPCLIRGNREMIRELADNLIQNAIRYNNEYGHVIVQCSTSNGITTLSVSDNGIGIPKEEQERIFERFYRVDKSRSKETGGTGLGLAIVKHIVEIHDAKIFIDSTVGKGTKIWVEF